MYFNVLTRQKNKKVFPTKHRKEAKKFKIFFKIKIGLLEVYLFSLAYWSKCMKNLFV